MQFTIAFTTLLAVASAAAVSQRSPVSVKGRDAGKLVARDGVCGGISNPLCCQLDVSGVANLNCENAGPVETTEEFQATCAESGKTAECCVLAVGADGLLCTAA